MSDSDFDHGLPSNRFNKHTWIVGDPDIGENVWIGAFCVIDALHAELTIGKGTDIASGAQVLTHSTVRRCISEGTQKNVDSAPTHIGEYCFIGANAAVLMGVTIGDHSVVGAGSVVTEGMVIPAHSVVIGVPARIIGSSRELLTEDDPEAAS